MAQPAPAPSDRPDDVVVEVLDHARCVVRPRLPAFEALAQEVYRALGPEGAGAQGDEYHIPAGSAEAVVRVVEESRRRRRRRSPSSGRPSGGTSRDCESRRESPAPPTQATRASSASTGRGSTRPSCQRPRVAVLVESLDQGRRLQRFLPGWLLLSYPPSPDEIGRAHRERRVIVMNTVAARPGGGRGGG
jgi:hypothetical protein